MYQKHALIILVLFVLFSQTNYAQSEDLSDWENWNSIGVKYKLNKKWAFELDEGLRLKEDMSEIDKYFTQLGTDYKITKNFKVGTAARYISENDNTGSVQGYENYFRFQFDATYDHKVNDFSFVYRVRYQNKNELGEDDYANQYLRFKASIGYNIHNWKLDPEFSAEIFNHIEKGEVDGFNKYRLTIGTTYNMKKYGEIKLYYRYRKQMNTINPKITNIVGLGYTYTIKNQKR